MGIPDELKKLIRKGDYTLIQEVYADRHAQGEDPDYNTVSLEYIRLVIEEKRPANPGTAAEEIEAIAIKLLEHRNNFINAVTI